MDIKDIPMAVISIAVAIIVVTTMSLLIVGVQDQTTDQSTFYGNQTLTWAGNNTAISFAEGRIDTSSVVLYNNGAVVNKGTNYTVTSESITILNDTDGGLEWITSDLNVSYNYLYGSSAYNATGQGLSANTTFSSFFPLIALVMIGAVVIGIVVRFFRKPE